MSIQATKSECGLEPFTLDWTELFTRHGLDPNVDLITTSTWDVTGGTKGSDFIATPDTTVVLSGGTIGGSIQAKNTIEINGGAYRDCRTLSVSIF